MKKILFIILSIFVAQFAFSQKPHLIKSEKVLNVGIGYNYYPLGSMSLDYCIADGLLEVASIGVGPFVAGGFTSSRLIFSLGARGTVHYPFFDILDTYAGVGLGASYHMWFNYSDNISFLPVMFLGARYPFSEKMSGFCEAGFGLSYFTLGVAFNL